MGAWIRHSLAVEGWGSPLVGGGDHVRAHLSELTIASAE